VPDIVKLVGQTWWKRFGEVCVEEAERCRRVSLGNAALIGVHILQLREIVTSWAAIVACLKV
jgi:hypothetical protein